MSVKMRPMAVKVSHGKSFHRINIPVSLAREVGLDKADWVLIVTRGDKKLEVKRYDKEEDGAEYFQGNQVIID